MKAPQNCEVNASDLRCVRGMFLLMSYEPLVLGLKGRVSLSHLTARDVVCPACRRDQRRLFPEWPLKPSTGKVNSASQWFAAEQGHAEAQYNLGTMYYLGQFPHANAA